MVSNEIAHRHRFAEALPGILKSHVLIDGRVEIELALLDQLHHRRFGEQLADRAGPEQRALGIHGPAFLDIVVAVALLQQDFAVLHDDDDASRDVTSLQFEVQKAIEPGLEVGARERGSRCRRRLGDGGFACGAESSANAALSEPRLQSTAARVLARRIRSPARCIWPGIYDANRQVGRLRVERSDRPGEWSTRSSACGTGAPAGGRCRLRTRPQLNVQLPADAELDVFDEIDVDDLLAIGAKEALRIEPLLQAVQGPSEQRTLRAPEQTDIIPFRQQHADFAQWHEPAALAIAHEQPLEDVVRLHVDRLDPPVPSAPS